MRLSGLILRFRGRAADPAVLRRGDHADHILEEAVRWQDALKRDDADWDEYTRWLESDPRHADAANDVALLDVLGSDDDRVVVQDFHDDESEPARRTVGAKMFLVGSLAVCGIGLASLPAFFSRPSDVVYATGPQEISTIKLARGTVIRLAPASRLLAKAGDPANLELARGEAFFQVAHDPNRELSIKLAGFVVRDIGTDFGVNNADGVVAVSVSKGDVTVTRSGDETPIALAAGQRMIARQTGVARIADIDPKDVGSWQRGRLVYDRVPLPLVAADISRYSGRDVIVEGALKSQLFSGVLVIGDGSRLAEAVAGLMAAKYRMEDGRIYLSAAVEP